MSQGWWVARSRPDLRTPDRREEIEEEGKKHRSILLEGRNLGPQVCPGQLSSAEVA